MSRESTTSGYRFTEYDDAAAYYRRVRSFLTEAEAEYNVLLGIIRQLATGDHDYRDPILLGAVEGDEGLAGCVWRTPPHKLGMTSLPQSPDLVDSIAAAVARRYEWVDGAVGPPDTVERFGRAWANLHGIGYSHGMRQGIYRLRRVVAAEDPTPGHFTVATTRDLDVVIEWADAFAVETGVFVGDPAARCSSLVQNGSMYLWQDGVPRSLAAAVAFTDNGVRIGFVYTPRQHRGRGYASALVAALSQTLLEDGNRYCSLYADLANSTSTGIYTRIGYEKVGEAIDIIFTPQTS